MSRRAKRILIPIVLIAVALGIVLVVALSPKKSPPTPSQQSTTTANQPADQADAEKLAEVDTASNGDESAEIGDETASNVSEDAVSDEVDDATDESALAAIDFTTLKPVQTGAAIDPDQLPSLGSLDPNAATMKIEFSPLGAGIARITSSDYWRTALTAKEAKEHHRAIEKGVPASQAPPLPPDDQRYVLTESNFLTDRFGGRFLVPAFAANAVRINGNLVGLLQLGDGSQGTPWSLIAPNTFQTRIEDGDGDPVLLITRTYSLGTDGDINLQQELENLTDAELNVQFIQYGPGQLTPDRSPYIDIRRFRAAYLPDPTNHPDIIVAKDNDQIFERMSLLKKAEKANKPGATQAEVAELSTIWPNDDSTKRGFELTWFASTNRYFALAVHPALAADGSGNKSLEDVVEEIRHQAENPGSRDTGVIFTILYSPTRAIPPQSSINLDFGIYAGPMQSDQLSANPIFESLELSGLILYQMSSFCAICTFQWLAHILLAVLEGIHFVLRDWSLAIIVLVIIVRTILHPITKKSQVNMQRFAKGMQALKPELEKLQKKYANDNKRLQQEQLRLWKEHNISPFQMLGCLPLVLQMPIWVALYASLYFAFDLRQQPALFGIFQLFGDWEFLADLASPDRFISFFPDPKSFTFLFLHFDYSSFNILPLLMGAIFFVQQKYLSPPPNPSMTKEQMQQQKIMRVMMVVMMPIVLYSAPSGLILYILISSTFGVLESRYIRSHIEQADLELAKKPAAPKKKGARDKYARAFAEAMERAKAKAEAKRKGPPKTFKKKPKG